MNKVKTFDLSLKRIVAFFATTLLIHSVLNLPAIFLANGVFAAATASYQISTLTTTDIGIGATNFKLMEFVLPDSSTSVTQDSLLLDGSVKTYSTNVLTSFPSDVRYIEQGGGTGFNSGDDVIKDLDNDQVYTSAADFLVDANGTTDTSAGTTSVVAGATLYDVVTSDYVLTNSVTAPAQVWHSKDMDTYFTSQADIFVDSDGYADLGSGTASGITVGSTFSSFAESDKVYYYNTAPTTVIDSLDDVEALWLSGDGGTYTAARTAYSNGTSLDFGTGVTLTSVTDALTLSYTFPDGSFAPSTITGTLDIGVVDSTTYNDVAVLAGDINTAIAGGSWAGKITATGMTDNGDYIKLSTVGTGYPYALTVTGGTGSALLGFTSPTQADGGDSVIYQTVDPTGQTGTLVSTTTSNNLVYLNATPTGYQSGEDIYIDQKGRTYSDSADDVVLGTVTAGTTGINVASTVKWVKELNATYNQGNDLFIENFGGELTYSSAADTMIVNGSYGAAAAGNALVAFGTDDKFVDSDVNSTYTAGEDIYREAAGAGGTVEYDALNAMTLSNAAATSAVPIEKITSLKMYYETNTGSPTYGGTESSVTFSAYPSGTPTHFRVVDQNIHIPDTTGLKVYVIANIASTVTEGQKIQMQADLLSDVGATPNRYDDGERGIFVANASDNGPTGTALVSTTVTVSSFGTLLSDMADSIDDFQEQIEDVMLSSSDDSYDDYNEDISDSIDSLETLLSQAIDSDSDVVNIFDELGTIINSMDSLSGLIPTTGDNAISDKDFEDTEETFRDAKNSMDDLVRTLGDVVLTAQEAKYEDEKDDYDDNWDDVEDTFREKNPDSGDLTGAIDYIDSLVEDLTEMKNNDVSAIDTVSELESFMDDFNDIIDNAETEISDLDIAEEYDEDDLDELSDSVDDLRDEAESLITALEDRLATVDTANGNNSLNDEYEDEDYENDIMDSLDNVDDSYDELKGAEVQSEDVGGALSDIEDIQDDVEELSDDITDIPASPTELQAESEMKDIMGNLQDAYDDATDVVGDVPCVIADDDFDELESAIDDLRDAIGDIKSELKSGLQSRNAYTALEDDFSDEEDDLDSAEEDLDDAIAEIEDVEGRCEGSDSDGPASVVLVADNYSLIIDSKGVDTAKITATVRDKTGAAVENKVITFTISSPLSNQGSLSGTSLRTSATGQVEVEYTPSANTSGKVTIKAYSATNTDVAGTVQFDVYNSVTGEGTNTELEEGEGDDDTSGEVDNTGVEQTGNVLDGSDADVVAAELEVVESVLNPAEGGIVKVEVKDEEGNLISNETVTLSLRNSNGDINSYTATSDDTGTAIFLIPQTDFAPDQTYAAVASLADGEVSSGIFDVKSASSTDNTGDGSVAQEVQGTTGGDGGGQVLGESVTNLPNTGSFQIFTFLFSLFTTFLIFRKKKECIA